MTAQPLTGFGLGLLIYYPGQYAPADFPSLLDEHGILLIRGLSLDGAGYCAVAAEFGELEPVFPAAHQEPGEPFIRLQSNVGVGVSSGGEYWHADGPITEVPTAVTLLLCQEAPAAGGETLFADMRRAYSTLDGGLRGRIEERRGRYPCREIGLREMRLAGIPEDEQRSKLGSLRDLHHPIVRRHPHTGRKALYLNQQWLEGFEDDPADDEGLLPPLYAHATRDDNVYRHRWLPGDLLVWDNASVMHRALPPGEGSRKITRRITVAGGEPARPVALLSGSPTQEMT